jgi:alkanesulfonate monooxygenase SsuD/methylene tetrahydromethanopterin reductase-like flavin-dependent oxidoreductase (luciferase family)
MPFPKQDIKNPEDFENMAKLVRIEHFANRMLISADLDEHAAQIQRFVDMGFDEVYIHNVGRDQAAFIDAFGEKVLPNLKLYYRPTDADAALSRHRLDPAPRP